MHKIRTKISLGINMTKLMVNGINTQKSCTKFSVGVRDDVLIRSIIDISRLKLKLFVAVLVTMLTDIACVNGSELLARCIATEMIVIAVLTIIMTNTIAVFIDAVYVKDNGIIKTIIVVHTNDLFCLPFICLSKINPGTVTGGLTTTMKQFIAVVIAVSIVYVYGKELLILRLIDITYCQFYHDIVSSVITTITIAIIILMKNKLKPSITVFASTMFRAAKLANNDNNLFYVIPVMFMYTTQLKIYPCTISSTLIILTVNEFIELFQQITTKPFIADIMTDIVYVNGKVLQPFIAININVVAVHVNGQDLLLINTIINKCRMKLNSSVYSALFVIYLENKIKGVVPSAISITNMINVKPFIAVVRCYYICKWYEKISHINNTNSKLNGASLLQYESVYTVFAVRNQMSLLYVKW